MRIGLTASTLFSRASSLAQNVMATIFPVDLSCVALDRADSRVHSHSPSFLGGPSQSFFLQARFARCLLGRGIAVAFSRAVDARPEVFFCRLTSRAVLATSRATSSHARRRSESGLHFGDYPLLERARDYEAVAAIINSRREEVGVGLARAVRHRREVGSG